VYWEKEDRSVLFDYLVSLFLSPEKGAISQHRATPYEKKERKLSPEGAE